MLLYQNLKVFMFLAYSFSYQLQKSAQFHYEYLGHLGESEVRATWQQDIAMVINVYSEARGKVPLDVLKSKAAKKGGHSHLKLAKRGSIRPGAC